MSGDNVIYVPFGWDEYRKGKFTAVGGSSFRLGIIVYTCQRGTRILLRTESKSYELHPPNTDEGRNQIEAFKLNFPRFPYYRNYHMYENVIDINTRVNEMNVRIDSIENKFITMISHLESIMICIGSRPANADNMILEQSNQ